MLQAGYLQQENVISLLRTCKIRVAVVLLDLEGLPALLSPLECVGSQDDSQRFVAGEIKHSGCHQLVPVSPDNTEAHLPGAWPGESNHTDTVYIYSLDTKYIIYALLKKNGGSKQLCQWICPAKRQSKLPSDRPELCKGSFISRPRAGHIWSSVAALLFWASQARGSPGISKSGPFSALYITCRRCCLRRIGKDLGYMQESLPSSQVSLGHPSSWVLLVPTPCCYPGMGTGPEPVTGTRAELSALRCVGATLRAVDIWKSPSAHPYPSWRDGKGLGKQLARRK